MKRAKSTLAIIGAGLSLAASNTSTSLAKELTLGFISTLSGGVAVIGKAQVNGLMLGLENHGWKKDGDKLAGVPLKVVIGDDQAKAEVGLRLARKMVQGNKAQIIGGVLWSHVLLAIRRYVTRSGRILITTNAGPSYIAGRGCNHLLISTSFLADEAAQAMGLLMNRDKLSNVYLIAPNYQAGKDYLAGFRRTFKGKVAGQILFKVGQTDHQADLAKVRAVKPSAVFIFAPGGMGISFLKQWAASGIGKSIKLYTIHTVDYLSLRPIGKAAVGSYHINQWKADAPNERNREFVKAYLAKYKSMPSMFSVPPYDMVNLLEDALKAVHGNIDNLPNLAAAMRKVGLRSVRGDLKFNVNGILIQPWYRREVVLNEQGAPMIKGGESVMFRKDSFWKECPKKE